MVKTKSNLAILRDQKEFAVGALTTLNLITLGTRLDTSKEQGFRISKTRFLISWSAKTTLEGPVVLGASTGMNAAEVEEAVESDPQAMFDIPGKEQAARPHWPLCIVGAVTEVNGVINNGLPFDRKFNWSIREGAGFDLWAYNMSTGSITTGMLFHVFMEHFGVWLRD